MILSAATFSQFKHTGSPSIHNGVGGRVGGCKGIKNREARRDVEQKEAVNNFRRPGKNFCKWRC